MCLQDLAIGRRTIYAQQLVPIGDTTAPFFLAGNPRRLGLMVSTRSTSFNCRASTTADLNSIVWTWNGIPTASTQQLTVDKFGPFVTGDLWLFSSATAFNGMVMEWIADYELDKIVQREVG